jgi:hypothetical protein
MENAALARREDLVVQELPEEVLVYDLREHKAHCLNRSAAFVWNQCDGNTSTSAIAQRMAQEWGEAVHEDLVWLALKQLAKAELLQKAASRPGGDIRVSRRAAMRRLGVGTTVALPFVTSIIAPTALAGASVVIPPVCQSCIKKIGDALACPTICLDVVGRCFDNSGCGQGGSLVCQTCAACAGNHGAADTVSWVAPYPGC